MINEITLETRQPFLSSPTFFFLSHKMANGSRKSFTKTRSGKVAKDDLLGEESGDLPHRGSSRHRNEA